MPQLELTELEAKVLWLIMDDIRENPFSDIEMYNASLALWDKVYRAYREMPPKEAA